MGWLSSQRSGSICKGGLWNRAGWTSTDMISKRKLLLFGGVATGLILVYFTLCFYWATSLFRTPSPPEVMPFDREIWVNPALRDERWDMVHDLQGNHLTLGMTEAEVRKLLGDPQRVFPSAEETGTRRGEPLSWYYDLGIKGYQLDCCDLVIVFDENSRLLRTFIWSN